jgi:hypothetical protein
LKQGGVGLLSYAEYIFSQQREFLLLSPKGDLSNKPDNLEKVISHEVLDVPPREMSHLCLGLAAV